MPKDGNLIFRMTVGPMKSQEIVSEPKAKKDFEGYFEKLEGAVFETLISNAGHLGTSIPEIYDPSPTRSPHPPDLEGFHDSTIEWTME